MLAGPDGLEPNEGDLHGQQQAEDVEHGVAGEQPHGVAAHQQQHKHVQRDEVDDKHVASPCRYLQNIFNVSKGTIQINLTRFTNLTTTPPSA